MNLDVAPSVLLVEDDEVDIMNVKRAFKKNNITNPLYVAQNGLEALSLLRDTEWTDQKPRPKLIISDINMPKMNGIEFIQELRKDDDLKTLTVFIMTTSSEDSDKFDAYKLNVAGYIVKPMSFAKFVSAVGTLNEFWNLCE